MLTKGAGKAYREYRTAMLKKGEKPLSFVEYINAEKERFHNANGQETVILTDRTLNDSIQTAINSTLKQGGLKTSESGKTIFGINKWIVVGSAVLLLGSGIYFLATRKAK